MTKNQGHGHVFPRPDGVRARCGGPAICPECAKDAARKASDQCCGTCKWWGRREPRPERFAPCRAPVPEAIHHWIAEELHVVSFPAFMKMDDAGSNCPAYERLAPEPKADPVETGRCDHEAKWPGGHLHCVRPLGHDGRHEYLDNKGRSYSENRHAEPKATHAGGHYCAICDTYTPGPYTKELHKPGCAGDVQ